MGRGSRLMLWTEVEGKDFKDGKKILGRLRLASPRIAINGKDYIQRTYTTFEWRDIDWHEAYHSIIDSVVAGSNMALPKLPLITAEIEEFGAYWEGAVYWLHQHHLMMLS